MESFSNSQELTELFKALSQAQSQLKEAKLDAVNPHFKSRYATLSSVQEAYKEALTKNGLCLIQQIFSNEGNYFIRSVLGHSSGQWISNVFKLIIQKNDMQGLGSAITYGRRYGACSLIGIVDTEDDDGNLAVKNDSQKKGVTNGNKNISRGSQHSPRGDQSTLQNGLSTNHAPQSSGERKPSSSGNAPSNPEHDKGIQGKDDGPRGGHPGDGASSDNIPAPDFNVDDNEWPWPDPSNQSSAEEKPKESAPANNERKFNLTEAQIKRLFAITKGAGWTNEQVKSFLFTFYNVESTKDLSWANYENFTKMVETLKDFNLCVNRMNLKK